MLIRFKTRLMAIPAKQAPLLAKKTSQTEIFKLLKTGVDEALEELADYDTLFGGGEDAGADKNTVSEDTKNA